MNQKIFNDLVKKQPTRISYIHYVHKIAKKINYDSRTVRKKFKDISKMTVGETLLFKEAIGLSNRQYNTIFALKED